MTQIGESAPSDKDLNRAARQLRARLESMLEKIPDLDPAHMDVSAQRWADMRREGGRPQTRKYAGKTATPSFYMQRFERVQ